MSAGAAVISNAGPLMVLAKLNLLHLLKSLYGRVHFSRSVCAGREITRKHGVRVRGSLGVLVEAHQRGLIGSEQLRAYFTEMARREDIWVSRALVERLLGEVFADQV